MISMTELVDFRISKKTDDFGTQLVELFCD
jgi:hypothetical protein